ncbi:MAG: dTMP kinase [Syntrophomonadaceae bacterium]|jgi:dTMP kinase|nr:dTMP kinase [Syntrophomonadaceae bacterium]
MERYEIMAGQGWFFSFEGIDGVGKTTLIKKLMDFFKEKNYPAVYVREPGGTLISEKIRELLLDIKNTGILPKTEYLLYAAARMQLVQEIIMPSLEQGHMVLADRYTDSSLAYQGYGRGIEREFLNNINDHCSMGFSPQLTFLLDMDPEEAYKRKKEEGPDRVEQMGLEFQKKVREGYLDLAAQNPERIIVINAGGELTEVEAQVKSCIIKYIKRHSA